LQICGESQTPYQKTIFLIHGHFDLKISLFDSKNRLPDVEMRLLLHYCWIMTPTSMPKMILEKRNEAIVSFLLDSGANIHAKDKDGRTPLHEASRYGQESVIS
jgi:hypothetical protein